MSIFSTPGKRFDQPPHHPFPKPTTHLRPFPLSLGAPCPGLALELRLRAQLRLLRARAAFWRGSEGGVRALEDTHVGLVLKGHQKDTHKLWLVSLFERKPKTCFGGCLCLGTLVGLVLKGNQKETNIHGGHFLDLKGNQKETRNPWRSTKFKTRLSILQAGKMRDTQRKFIQA